MNKIVSLAEIRKKLKRTKHVDISAELDYRTEKLLEALDEAYQRIEQLEKNLTALVRALKS